MKQDLKWALAIFGVILIAFFGIHFLFLLQQGFSQKSYLTGLVFLLPASLVVGYIFLTQLLERHERQEEHLEHLVREVLHEINLPIATIQANVEMARKRLEPEEEKLRKRLERIAASTHRLQKLYRELSYNIRREIMPIEKEPFDLAELLRERIAFFEELGRNKIVMELEPTEIVADKIGMEQVLDNLLENAMKYSPKSEKIEVTLRNGVLRIVDYGVGMDENELLHVFERYYQSDRRKKGEGIGLSIVKRYCDENGLTLKIRSRPGEGTEVSIYLDRLLSSKKVKG